MYIMDMIYEMCIEHGMKPEWAFAVTNSNDPIKIFELYMGFERLRAE